MALAFTLIALGAAWRLAIHFHLLGIPYHAVPLGAIALYAAARLPRRWALAVPLAIFLLSDLVIDTQHGYRFDLGSRLTTYALFALIVLAGQRVRSDASLATRVGMAVGAATFFFLASNFAVWLEGSGFAYPRTWAGLMSTYEAGVPFYRNNLVADVLGTLALFGAEPLVQRAFRHDPAARAAE